MPPNPQYPWFTFKRPKLEQNFLSESLRSSSDFRIETFLIFLLWLIYQNFILSFSNIFFIFLYFAMLFCLNQQQKSRNFSQNKFFLIILNIFNIIISREIYIISVQNPIFLQIWFFFFTIFTQKTWKYLLFYAFSSSFLLNLSFTGFNYPNFLNIIQNLPYTFFLIFSFEKQTRKNWIQNEKDTVHWKSLAQTTDLLINPIMIINRNGCIKFTNTSALQILKENFCKNYIFPLISQKDQGHFEETLNEIEQNEPPVSKRIELNNQQMFEITFRSIIFNRIPAILLVFSDNKSEQSMLQNFSFINKTFSKMSTNLLENMETDYNKWSNLQSLKYIKQSDMKLLASCVMEANFLQCLIHANVDKTHILLSHHKKIKNNVFHIRNTILQILEIISVLSISKHQEILLKFEESFPEKVSGDYSRFKQSLLIIWRQISMKFDQSTFQMQCRLKEFNKTNQFVLVFLLIFPKNEDFASLLHQVCDDTASLSYNILNKTYSSFDLLMFKPTISLLTGLVSFEDSNENTNILSLELPFEPAAEFEAKNQTLNNKNPFSLTFCRTNPDRNSYKWKEIQFLNEKPRLQLASGPVKFKKINVLKEIPKSLVNSCNNGVLTISNEESESPLMNTSSKELSEKGSSLEESPEIEARSRKKTHSCFSNQQNSGGSHASVHLEENKEKLLGEEFMTPQNKFNDQRNKAIIQEDLKDIEGTPIRNHSSDKIKGFDGTPIRKQITEFKNFEGLMQHLDLNPMNIEIKEKKNCFERGVYETLFKCWKSHEKSLKKTLLVTIHKILEKNTEGRKIKFSKAKLKGQQKERQNSLPMIKSQMNFFSSLSNNLKTPQWSSRVVKRNANIGKNIENLSFLDYQQEKLNFLNSRMVLSPRPLMRKFMPWGKKSGQIQKANPLVDEVMEGRFVTQRRRWIFRKL